jgi:hypothetical protein
MYSLNLLSFYLNEYRWPVEFFFKWIKQHLKIKSFWGTSENAVKIQIYSAIITYCLVAIVGADLKIERSTYEILQVVGISLLDKTLVTELLTNTDCKNIKALFYNQLSINWIEVDTSEQRRVKKMKKTTPRAALLLAFTLTALAAFSQSFSDLRPRWARVTPNPPAGANYFFSWGMGEASNETDATNAAWANALQKSLHELGAVGITQQDIDAVRARGISAVASFNRMKRRALCSTEFIAAPGGAGGKLYVLIQVQRSVTGADDFYSLSTSICDDPSFDKSLAGYSSRSTGEYGFSPRAFVPGMAQLHKGSAGKGIFFIAGEVALVGGIVIAESMRASYASKIGATHSPSSQQRYANSANGWSSARSGFIAGAAALYVWNVVDGWVARGKPRTIAGSRRLNVAPCLTPTAGGVVFALNF